MMEEKKSYRPSLLGTICCLSLLLLLTMPGVVFCQLEIPSSFNPVGQGARALGMGGAFIAVADDATAASWNPGGLIQLERPEVSIVGSYFHRTEDLDFGTRPEASGNQSVSKSRINFLSATYPFSVSEKNMAISINYQNLYDMNADWNYSFGLSSPGSSTALIENVDYKQTGALSAWGIGYCLQITPNFSLGTNLNIWEDGLEDTQWKQNTKIITTGTLFGQNFEESFEGTDKFSLSGINFNIGMLWNITPKMTFGAVVKTPFTADVTIKSSTVSVIRFPDIPDSTRTVSRSSTKDLELHFPLSLGFGLAYRFSDNFTMSLDFHRTQWNDFEWKDDEGNKTSAITGQPSNESDIEPTHQLRLGAEYLLITDKYVFPFRGGIFNDPAPADGSPDNYYGISIGTGIGYNRFAFDIAYQYRFGNDVKEYILEDQEFSEDVREHTVFTSVIFYF